MKNTKSNLKAAAKFVKAAKNTLKCPNISMEKRAFAEFVIKRWT